MPDDAPEPFVIVERPAAPTPLRRWTALRGRKPALILIDRGAPDGSGLDLPLAAEGFDVYRTTGHRSALDLLQAHPSVLMALVRTDLPNLDAPELVRDLRRVRPGLWIGLLCDPADRDGAAAGYAAGAVDLFPIATPPAETVSRLLRSVPWAVRLREGAERRLERPQRSVLRRVARRASSRAGTLLTLGAALLIGATLALVTRSWQATRDAENARIERILAALEARPPVVDRAERQFDRWQRQEQLDLQRQSQRMLGSYYQSQLEEERMRELLRLTAPHYPK
jgi:DNA-binding response OmpR family regulator